MLELELGAPARRTILLLAKAMIVALFLLSAYGKIKGWPNLVGTLAGKGFPLPLLFAVATIAVELFGSAGLFVPRFEKIAALALAAFTLAACFFFHAFWTMPPEAASSNMVHFFKDVAITGGLLVIVALPSTRSA